MITSKEQSDILISRLEDSVLGVKHRLERDRGPVGPKSHRQILAENNRDEFIEKVKKIQEERRLGINKQEKKADNGIAADINSTVSQRIIDQKLAVMRAEIENIRRLAEGQRQMASMDGAFPTARSVITATSDERVRPLNTYAIIGDNSPNTSVAETATENVEYGTKENAIIQISGGAINFSSKAKGLFFVTTTVVCDFDVSAFDTPTEWATDTFGYSQLIGTGVFATGVYDLQTLWQINHPQSGGYAHESKDLKLTHHIATIISVNGTTTGGFQITNAFTSANGFANLTIEHGHITIHRIDSRDDFDSGTYEA